MRCSVRWTRRLLSPKRAQTVLVAALWNLGSEEEARLTVRKMLANHHNLTASRWAQGWPYRHQKDLDALITPLRLAGMPE